jgi:hypothetical protein
MCLIYVLCPKLKYLVSTFSMRSKTVFMLSYIGKTFGKLLTSFSVLYMCVCVCLKSYSLKEQTLENITYQHFAKAEREKVQKLLMTNN